MRLFTKLIILPTLLLGCSPYEGKAIDLHYRESVTYTTDFYGSFCCRVEQKLNSSTYLLDCVDSGIYSRYITARNGEEGATLTKGCK